MEVLEIDPIDKDYERKHGEKECDKIVMELVEKYHKQVKEYSEEKKKKLSLVVTGISLRYCLHKKNRKIFEELTDCCHSIVCCRSDPSQKAKVVKLVREFHPHESTLAIGDGGLFFPNLFFFFINYF
jgi:magnesium-transporting ATPase (P-type)